ncbi:S8 family serine peptidase [Polyangium sorediatum]|uniref:S8 family serine peptidase n=1 Tax=Polyangium sorediatum TaxID=889274 RepID=A0ABT6NNT6_9BACT|nr:S8 family serine peptidase [Polyangium sorediatum]MDI1429943.1 S8 family serine peptidase [Polyangium sorediatum]
MTETSAEATNEARRVRVALVDSGVDTSHPWLVNAALRSLRVERKGEGYAVGPDEPVDRSGHGTACAGIIHRLAPFAEITSVCVLSPEGRCSRDGLLAATRFCVREGFDVVNLSLGIDVPKGAPLRPTDYKSIVELYEIADIAYTAGVVLVASGPNASAFRTYPGRFKSLIGVGRASSDDPEFLRTEITADWEILAPGNDVLAPALGGGERRWTGTSFAAPHVAAHVARLRRDRSDFSIQDIKAALHALAARRLEREAGLPRVSLPPAQIDHGGALSS